MFRQKNPQFFPKVMIKIGLLTNRARWTNFFTTPFSFIFLWFCISGHKLCIRNSGAIWLKCQIKSLIKIKILNPTEIKVNLMPWWFEMWDKAIFNLKFKGKDFFNHATLSFQSISTNILVKFLIMNMDHLLWKSGHF